MKKVALKYHQLNQGLKLKNHNFNNKMIIVLLSSETKFLIQLGQHLT